MSEDGPEGLHMAEAQRLEDLVDREGLEEVCKTFHDMFGLPVRVFARDGSLVARSDVEPPHRDLDLEPDALRRLACPEPLGAGSVFPRGAETVAHPHRDDVVYQCVPILYDGRALGRCVVGPHRLSASAGAPEDRLPHLDRATAERLTRHLARVLDVILFSGHRAYLSGQLHLASARDSYRELAEKTRELQHAYDELKELDRLKSNFLATISHELRTPLTSIIGYSEMLATGLAGPLEEEQASFVDTIRQKGDQLLALIGTLLDTASFEQGRLDLRHEHVDPAALVADIARTVQPLASAKGVRVSSRADGDLFPVIGDPVRLRQVLQNLADNAVKFTPLGGEVRLLARLGELPAHTDARGGAGAVLRMAPRRALELVVTDTGPGIPEEERERIFDAFYQVDGSVTREHGGTGLGLSIVRRLVDAHGGTVRVHSQPGQGATFVVALPEDGPMG